MSRTLIHRFEHGGRRFAIDPESCFCFECDAISWDVLEHYPHETVNRIYHLLEGRHDRREVAEVIGELEWLRASKSILTPPSKENILKAFELERGLKRLTLWMPGPESAPARARRRWFERDAARSAPPVFEERGRRAAALLMSRSEAQKDLRLELAATAGAAQPEAAAAVCGEALRLARLAGKNLTAAVRVDGVTLADAPPALEGHALSAQLEFQDLDADAILPHVRALAKAVRGGSLKSLARALEPGASAVAGRIIVRPGHPEFGGVACALDEAGSAAIELDLDAAYVAQPSLDPASMLDGVSRAARYYAERLLKHHYFRLDPIAGLFWRIYTGSPARRTDPAGANELAVDAAGCIYPSRLLAGQETFRCGELDTGAIDEDVLRRFEDVGAATTAPCITCWARHLCGGGTAAVHHALTGSFRAPHPAWCEAQRAWMEAAVSAFQILSSAGVHFDRVYKAIGRQEKPSLFTIAKAALTLSIAVRPIEEADAERLAQWENWNEAAYFLFNETGCLLATRYDREMDSLHPRRADHELVLLRKNGEPFGLLKVRPAGLPRAAVVWVYMRDPADYASGSIRRSFRAVLNEAASAYPVSRIVTPAGPGDAGLPAFLEAVGFRREGVQREALYLHGRYHDIEIYSLETASAS